MSIDHRNARKNVLTRQRAHLCLGLPVSPFFFVFFFSLFHGTFESNGGFLVFSLLFFFSISFRWQDKRRENVHSWTAWTSWIVELIRRSVNDLAGWHGNYLMSKVFKDRKAFQDESQSKRRFNHRVVWLFVRNCIVRERWSRALPARFFFSFFQRSALCYTRRCFFFN